MRALLLAVFVAACTAPPIKGANAPVERPLAGTRWVMMTDAAAAPTLVFGDSERASGFTGCNQWFAQVDRADGALLFNAVGMTRRACEPGAMDTERSFGEALERTRAAQFDDDTLTLIDETGEAIARFERAR
jgi:heat shock protein HslJ